MSNRLTQNSFRLVKRAAAPAPCPLETEEERELRIYGDPRFIANKVDRHVCS